MMRAPLAADTIDASRLAPCVLGPVAGVVATSPGAMNNGAVSFAFGVVQSLVNKGKMVRNHSAPSIRRQ